MRGKIVFFAGALVLLVLMVSLTSAFTNEGGSCSCNSCGDCNSALTSSSCTNVALTQDVTTGTVCIDDRSTSQSFSNKIFDCKGFSISGGVWDGVRLQKTNLMTVKNCRIFGFGHAGIYIPGSISQNNIINNTIFNNEYGIYDYYGPNNISFNKVYNNSVSGIAVGARSGYDFTANNFACNNTAPGSASYGYDIGQSNSPNSVGIINSNICDTVYGSGACVNRCTPCDNNHCSTGDDCNFKLSAKSSCSTVVLDNDLIDKSILISGANKVFDLNNKKIVRVSPISSGNMPIGVLVQASNVTIKNGEVNGFKGGGILGTSLGAPYGSAGIWVGAIAGGSVVSDKVSINNVKFNDNDNAIVIFDRSGNTNLRHVSANNIITNVQIVGLGDISNGIWLSRVSNNSLKGITIRNVGEGIVSDYSGVTKGPVWIDSVLIDNVVRKGIRVSAPNNSYFTHIKGVSILNSQKNGLEVSGSGLMFRDSIIRDSFEDGLYSSVVKDLRIYNISICNSLGRDIRTVQTTFTNVLSQYITCDTSTESNVCGNSCGAIVPTTCQDVCTMGATQCSGAQIKTCSLQANGCTDWSAPVNCAAGGSCNSATNSCQTIVAGGCTSDSQCTTAPNTICNITTGVCGPATCVPQCSGKVCGSDGCGGTCGSCTTGNSCNSQGQCVASSTPCNPVCQSNQQCLAGTCVLRPSISNAYWASGDNLIAVTDAGIGNSVKMVVETENIADGTAVVFTIYENDLVLDNQIRTVNGVVQNNKVNVSWTITQADYELGDTAVLDLDNLEFYFTVAVSGRTATSDDLNVGEQTVIIEDPDTTDDGGDGTIHTCEDYINIDSCENDVDNVNFEVVYGAADCNTEDGVDCACVWNEVIEDGSCQFNREVVDVSPGNGGGNGGSSETCSYSYSCECINDVQTCNVVGEGTACEEPTTITGICGQTRLFQLPFFNWVNGLAAILIIVALYLIIFKTKTFSKKSNKKSRRK